VVRVVQLARFALDHGQAQVKGRLGGVVGGDLLREASVPVPQSRGSRVSTYLSVGVRKRLTFTNPLHNAYTPHTHFAATPCRIQLR
jgi:hypothetical protein